MKNILPTLSSALLLIAALAASALMAAEDPLPSWNDGPVKASITAFVDKVTIEDSPHYVPPAERIATFDNDGTLWCEKPMYFQMIFAFDRIQALAPEHPEWKTQAPFNAVLANDLQAFGATGQKGLLEVIASTHAGMNVDEFHALVANWLRTARHPRFDRPYNELTYQPMHELLTYLRSKNFQTFIVSGGGIEFMRPWAPAAYGIPPQQIVGSSGVVRFEIRDGTPILVKQTKVEFVDDGPGKPVGINRFIGRRPLMAFGNSDGDLEMLQWTTEGEPSRKRPGFALVVHHTDAVREYAYDRDSNVGRLDKAWDEATRKGWTIVDMKRDWNQIFRQTSQDR